MTTNVSTPAPAPDPPPKPTLLWLASYPKSGNTWVRMLLTAYTNPTADSQLSFNQVKRVTVMESAMIHYTRAAGRDDLGPEEIDQLRPQVQWNLSQRKQRHALIKTHNARVTFNGVPLIRDDLTRAAVYIVRNPLDIVDSFADHWGIEHDVAIERINSDRHTIGGGPGAKQVTQHLRNWSQHVSSWLDHNLFPTLVIRYEDMLASPEIALRNIITFLGWKLSGPRLRAAIEQTRLEGLVQRESNEGFRERSENSKTGQFFRHGKSGRWRDVLRPDQSAKICDRHAGVMTRIGYDRS